MYGVGYGAKVLSEVTLICVFDASQDAFAVAEAHYKNDKTDFALGSYPGIDVPCPFDFVVALEATEHLVDHRGFLSLTSENMNPGGVLLSTPNSEIMPLVKGRHKFHEHHCYPEELVKAAADL